MQFTNPRLQATFDNWPSGSKRINCTFQVERDERRGYRVSRVTTGKPKYTTYGSKAAIVDGDDGRTYILRISMSYGHIDVYASDFMQGQKPVFPGDADYATLLAMIEWANSNGKDVPGPGGRCDTCGAPCDAHGCLSSRAHKVAITAA